MTKLRTSKSLPRREALKGLGALALSAPGLAAVGCAGEQGSNASESPLASSGAGAAGLQSGRAGTSPSATSTAGLQAHSGSAGTLTQPAMQTSPRPAVSSPVAGAGPAGAGGQLAAGTSAAGTPAASAGRGGMTAPTAGASGSAADGGPGMFFPVTFDTVASCMLTPTDPAGEGPFFIHEDEVMNDAALMRYDMREGRPGVELQLNLRVLDSDGKCMKPISGVEVYTWHTDASGFYSGFNNQNPDQSYSGSIERTVENMERFCRGIQVTDSQGVVRFKTVYPGWYNGRAIHIHFLALRPDSSPDTTNYRGSKSMVFTTQMYFAEAFSRMIHEGNMPYKMRSSGSAYDKYVKPQNTTVNPSMRMEGNVAVGALNIITSATGSRR